MNYIDPDAENWALFKSLPRDRPVHMLNFIRLKEIAEYAPDHPCAGLGWSGERAYQEYFDRLSTFLAPLGASVVWEGEFECMVTGPARFEWDKVFVMGFPSGNAFFAMIASPEYKTEIVPHRTAAVLDSRLVRYAPKGAG